MKISEKFEELRKEGEGAFMAHVYYGDPSEEFSLAQIKALVEGGVDLLEFGIPFSDPTADGPTFQGACRRVLDGGMTPSRCIEGIKKVRGAGVEVPIIVTTYYNVVYRMGDAKFIKRIKEAGAQGIIVPNVPIEEAAPLLNAGKEHGIDVILLATQNTSDERLERIVENARGFIYVVNVRGVTGARKSLKEDTIELIKRIRSQTGLPLMAGFGISRPEHAAAVVEAGADGAIVGSAIGKIYAGKLPDAESALPDIREFAQEMKNACGQGLLRRKDK